MLGMMGDLSAGMDGMGYGKLANAYAKDKRVRIVREKYLHPALTFSRSTTGTYLGKDGLLHTAAINEPRFEFDANGNYLGLLTEQASTNLMKYSDGDVTKYTTRSGVTDATTPIATFANSIQFGDNSGLRYAYTGSSGLVVAGTAYAVSFFVQMDDGNAPVPGTSSSSAFDFSISIGGPLATGVSVVQISGSLYRVIGTGVAGSNPGNNGVVKYTTQSARTFRMTGLQIEPGGQATSYMPSTGVTVTRSADVCSSSSVAFLGYGQQASTLYCEGDFGSGDSTVNSGGRAFAAITDSAGSNALAIYNGAGTITGLCNSSGVSQADCSGGAIAANTPFKFALAAAQDNFRSGTNGVLSTPDGSGLMPVAPSLLIVGSSSLGGANLNGHIKKLDYYPRRLSDAAIQALTT